MKEFKSISRMIKRDLIVSDDPPADDITQKAIVKYWRNHAGIAAPHTYPLLFASGRLVIFCESAAWATQIRHQTLSLVRQLKEQNFNVSKVQTKIRPVATVQPNPPTPSKPVNLISKGNAEAIRSLANSVTHGGLKQSLSRLSKRSVKK